MKNIAIVLLVLFISSCKAQTIVSLSTATSWDYGHNNYIQDTDGVLDPFIGTWRWTDTATSSEFTVVFVKKLMYNPENSNGYSVDKIMGGYKYIHNGVLIVDTTVFTTVFNSSSVATLANYAPILSSISSPFESLSLNLDDRVKGKVCKGSFDFINPQPHPSGGIFSNQARWKMWDREHWTINGVNPLPIGFSIPTDVVLTKVY
jgi:hypothetical protein